MLAPILDHALALGAIDAKEVTHLRRALRDRDAAGAFFVAALELHRHRHSTLEHPSTQDARARTETIVMPSAPRSCSSPAQAAAG